MLRRYEIYPVDPAASAEAREAMNVGIRDCANFIPELLHSAIGHAESETNLNFVWEHAYQSPEHYQRYMRHPYHAAILDRFLMNDSPERIIVDNPHGLGLVGYDIDEPDYLLPAGAARRLVALQLAEGSQERFAGIAKEEAERCGMINSIFEYNSFAAKWFDGETDTGLPTNWTHLWEQGFADLDAARAYQPQWREKAGDMVEDSIELLYELEAGVGYPEVK
ncbi:MAG: hypothetical protein P8J20_04500 [Novosphingobium sp.]|nr:hypothetical protein [Novosphingobium sp.]